jgi:hypothetical protein
MSALAATSIAPLPSPINPPAHSSNGKTGAIARMSSPAANRPIAVIRMIRALQRWLSAPATSNATKYPLKVALMMRPARSIDRCMTRETSGRNGPIHPA